MDDMAGLVKRFKLGGNQLKSLPGIVKSAGEFGKRRASEIPGEREPAPKGKRRPGRMPPSRKPPVGNKPPQKPKPKPIPNPRPGPTPSPIPYGRGPSAEEALGVKKQSKPPVKGGY